MKKLIVGLMGFVLMGAMALPVAAQGRSWNRDNQTNLRRDNNQRDNSDFSRRDDDQRDNRYDRGRQNEYDNFGRRNSLKQQDRQSLRLNATFLNLLLRH